MSNPEKKRSIVQTRQEVSRAFPSAELSPVQEPLPCRAQGTANHSLCCLMAEHLRGSQQPSQSSSVDAELVREITVLCPVLLGKAPWASSCRNQLLIKFTPAQSLGRARIWFIIQITTPQRHENTLLEVYTALHIAWESCSLASWIMGHWKTLKCRLRALVCLRLWHM